ncbi:MAG: 30S ribosomal protein S17 [Gammaproteobacteria bacterium]|nr:MAG: 30S ribosomal protein S17 [Gammaproteobacteria bacterium]|tara:strand:- start:42246 stop:42530 length:285 start_codon:yes stop_codon:yes gene_type:complete
MTEKSENKTNKLRRPMIGKVVSNKMDKSVSVAIERLIKHPIYGKYIRRTTKIVAHDEENKCQEGDTVSISPCKPISKNKSWNVVNINNTGTDKQ